MENQIKEIVNKYIHKYNTRNPFKLADILGIEVQMGTPGCAGCYMFLKNHRYIFLDQNLTEMELFCAWLGFGTCFVVIVLRKGLTG